MVLCAGLLRVLGLVVFFLSHASTATPGIRAKCSVNSLQELVAGLTSPECATGVQAAAAADLSGVTAAAATSGDMCGMQAQHASKFKSSTRWITPEHSPRIPPSPP